MERKIGEIFEFGGVWYQCVEADNNDCIGCDLKALCPYSKEVSQNTRFCSSKLRNDGKSVIFKKLEKVGEPFTISGTLYQHYKVFDIDNVCGDGFWCVHNYNAKTLTIEIKQNKEDMEEKEQCGDNRFEVIEKAKRHLLHSTNIESSKEEMELLDVFLLHCWQMGWLDSYDDTKHSNFENIGKNLKEFDINLAKQGNPVCTRDGRKVRIICFDAKCADTPIVALVSRKNEEEYLLRYYRNGKFRNDEDSGADLMMLPEKKEGWVNVYKGLVCISVYPRIYKSREEAVSDNTAVNRIDTVKICWEE